MMGTPYSVSGKLTLSSFIVQTYIRHMKAKLCVFMIILIWIMYIVFMHTCARVVIAVGIIQTLIVYDLQEENVKAQKFLHLTITFMSELCRKLGSFKCYSKL